MQNVKALIMTPFGEFSLMILTYYSFFRGPLLETYMYDTFPRLFVDDAFVILFDLYRRNMRRIHRDRVLR